MRCVLASMLDAFMRCMDSAWEMHSQHIVAITSSGTGGPTAHTIPGRCLTFDLDLPALECKKLMLHSHSTSRLVGARSLRSSSHLARQVSMLSSIKQALSQAGHALTDGTREGGASGASTVAILDPAPTVADSRNSKINIAGFELEGVSVSAQETSITVPRAKVVFDLGRCFQRAIFQQTALISHGHLDHIGGAPFHVSSRNLAGLPPSKLVVHPSYVERLKKFVDAANDLQGVPPPPCPYEIIPLEMGQELVLPSGYICRPFPTTHSIPSQGYVLYSVRKKLKADLQGKSQDEIKALRLAGEEVQENHQVPEIAFTGDTTAAFLDQEGIEDVLRAKLLIVEMTFVDDSTTVEEARQKGHMHIADFITHAHRLQNEAILLIHFSSRYKRSEIVRNLNMWLPPALKAKCVPLLNGITD